MNTTETKTSELCKVSAGDANAPYSKKFVISNSDITLTQGGLIHSIEVDGVLCGNKGPGATSFSLEKGEYFNGFEINSAPYLQLGHVVNGFKMTTNKGRKLEVNSAQLPTKTEAGVSAIVKNCYVYGIEVVYGTLINQITFNYISNFTPLQ